MTARRASERVREREGVWPHCAPSMYELNRTCSTCVRVVCVWLWASLALGRNAEAKSSGVCRLVADVSYSLSTSRRRDMQIYASPRVNRLHRGVISFGGPTADQASVHSNINHESGHAKGAISPIISYRHRGLCGLFHQILSSSNHST